VAKKAAAKRLRGSRADANAEAASIQAAYADALKNQVQVLIDNYIAGVPDPEGKFQAGLAVIRKARDKALQLVQS